MQVPGIELGAVTLLEALYIDRSDVIYQIDLPGTQGCQAHRVLFFGLADDLVEVGQVVAFGVGLPIVLETHQPGLTPACPGDKLKWPRANGPFRGSVEGFWGLQVGGIVHDVGRQRGIWLAQVEPYCVFVQDVHRRDALYGTVFLLSNDSRVFLPSVPTLHRHHTDLATR